MSYSNCSQKMAVTPALAIAGGLIDSFKASKLKAAEAGTKTFTKPKTLVGKLIGGLSGRTAAASYQSELSTTSSPMVIESAKPELRQTPVTGGFSFGGEATKKTYLPFAIVAAIIAIFYFMKRKGGRRRR